MNADQETKEKEMTTNEQIRDGFNRVIAQVNDPEAIARMEVVREFFTNADFKAKMEQFVWEKNQKA